MRTLLALALLCISTISAQVSVAITSPQPGEQIGQIYQGPFSSQLGTASSTAGSITSVTINVDGTPCGASCVINIGAGTFGGNIYAKDLTAGSHVFTAIATDSMSNTATSAGVTATVVHSNPVCSHNLVGGTIYAERCSTQSVNANTITLSDTGLSTGDTIFVSASAGKPGSKQGTLTTSLTAIATTFIVNEQACIDGSGCGWPSTPFYALLSDPAASEKVHVTAITGTGPWTFTVDARGVAGTDCVIAGPSYPAGGPNTTVPSTCTAASTHTTATIVNVWQLQFLPINAISDTFGLTWNVILRETSGPIGDGANSPGGIWYAKAPSPTGAITITVTDPTVTVFIADSIIYSGLAAIEATAPGLQSGFGAPEGGGNATTGNYTSVPGDLNIGFIGGAPVIPVTGQTLRLQAGSRPLLFIQDQYSTSTTANMSALMNAEGFGAWGYAFKPVAGTGIPVLWTSASAPCWAATSPEIGIPWDTSGHHTNQLIGTGSTGTGSITYAWSITAGPNSPTIVSPTSATTTVTGVVAGQYTAKLCITDSTGSSCNTLTIGALGIDANGIVIPSDPNVSKFFIAIIALGYNHHCYADERAITGTKLQISQNPYPALAASWLTKATGTISYPFGGVGPGSFQVGCYGSGSSGGTVPVLSAGITATATSIAITHAECLHGLLNLPTRIYIGPPGAVEVVRITATTATTGNATLTVGYDGRGQSGSNTTNFQQVVSAKAWSMGASLGEMVIVGSGTSFISDAVRPWCPSGAPGPPGPVVYNTGTVTLTAGSPTVTLSGGTWDISTLPAFFDPQMNFTSGFIRITATHASGTPFVFIGKFLSLTDSTHAVLDRPAPTGVDGTAFSYKITSQEWWSLEFSQSGLTYRALQQPLGCESETVAFTLSDEDISSLDYTIQSSMGISYVLAIGVAQSQFGPNFYGTGIAARKQYLRSGITAWLDFANSIDENWVRDPEVCGGLCGGLALLLGGGAMGGIIDKVLNHSTILNWLDISNFALSGAAKALTNCNADDPRDDGYQQAWLASIALFDPDPTRQTAYTTGLRNWNTRDLTCRRNASDGYGTTNSSNDSLYEVNSWAGSSQWNTGGSPALTLTNNSTSATGTGLTAGLCAGQNDGTDTIHVITGSTVATVLSGTVLAGTRIYIVDTSVSPPYVGTSEYTISGNTVTLALVWNGSIGDFKYMYEDNSLGASYSAIGTSPQDWAVGGTPTDIATGLTNNRMLRKHWACKYVDSGHLILNRPWDGANGSSYHIAHANVEGFEVQEFMLGVKSFALKLGSLHPDATIAATNKTLRGQLGVWMATYGVDLNGPGTDLVPTGTLGTYYDRVFDSCEPPGQPNITTPFYSIHGGIDSLGLADGCGIMGIKQSTNGELPARVNTAEAYHALEGYYEYQCTLGRLQCDAARAFIDLRYAAIYGKCSMTSGGGATYFCDSHYVNEAGELSNGAIGNYKWYGFFFGMGMGDQWPAVEQLGVLFSFPKYQNQGDIKDKGGVRN